MNDVTLNRFGVGPGQDAVNRRKKVPTKFPRNDKLFSLSDTGEVTSHAAAGTGETVPPCSSQRT